MNNHEKGEDVEIPGMDISFDAIETFMNIPECLAAEKI